MNTSAQHVEKDIDQPNGVVSLGYSWYVIFILTVGYICNSADRYLIAALVEPIKEEFKLTDTAMGFLTGFAFVLFYTVFGLIIGRYADRSNRAKLLSLCIAVWSIITTLTAVVQSFAQLATARFLVAIGEAGGSPCSVSLVADYSAIGSRATATSIYCVGGALGTWLGFAVGGYIGETYGWRSAFLILGVPGLLLALLVLLTVRDPRVQRRSTPALEDPIATVSIGETLQFIWSQRTLRHVLIGCALIHIYIMAPIFWTPSFLIRSHDISLSDATSMLGQAIGIPGAVGLLLSGYVLDRLGKKDFRWHAKLLGIVYLIAFVPGVTIFLARDISTVYFALLAFGFLNYMILGSTMAIVTHLVPTSIRALTIAIFFFIINVAGNGIAPQMVGVLSDWLSASYGAESLRNAILILLPTTVWGAVHYLLAARTIREDYARVARID